jgi:hypothetical protein
MEERGMGPHGAACAPIGAEETAALWESRTGGALVTCPQDRGPMALAVDGQALAYRLVCVRCGAASPWFEAGSGGIRVRTGASQFPGASPARGTTDE